MSTESLWQSFASKTDYRALERDLTADVVVIGGGITGVTAAQLLSQAGLSVVVLEAERIGVSNTGHSTGNLYEVLGKELIEVRKKHSQEVVQKVIASRREAVDLVEENVRKFKIDCDFQRVPWFYYSATKEEESQVEELYDISKEIGLAVEDVDISYPSLGSRKAFRLEGQAQFNPLRYVQGVAQGIAGEKCLIFENSQVLEVESRGEMALAKTARGSVSARWVVHATHTPKGIMAYHTLLGPYREYGIACQIKDPQHPPGIFFGHHDSSSTLSTRLYEREGQHYLIVVGSPHKVGHGDTHRHMLDLERFATKHFEVIKFTHRWGGQHYRPADGLPYIGKKGSSSCTLVATGFSTHGLTYGTLAAQIMCDQLTGRENPYEKIYSATRLTPVKSAKNFIKENVNVFVSLVNDYLMTDKAPFSEVETGEGRVLDHKGQKLAVYRGDEGVKVCSAVCSHMGCLVHWNNDEESWDCPCHGSRFDTDGRVLEGPALLDLARADLDHWKVPLRNPVPTIKGELQTGEGT